MPAGRSLLCRTVHVACCTTRACCMAARPVSVVRDAAPTGARARVVRSPAVSGSATHLHARRSCMRKSVQTACVRARARVLWCVRASVNVLMHGERGRGRGRRRATLFFVDPVVEEAAQPSHVPLMRGVQCCNHLHAACNMQQSACNTHHTTRNVQHARCNTSHGPRNIRQTA